MFIREVGPSGFLFDLEVFHGANSGFVTAYAGIVSHDLAYCRLPNGRAEQEGELVFRRRMNNGTRIIEVEETAPCNHYRGARAFFDGSFAREREPWFDANFMDEIEIARLHTVLGEHLEKMRSCTSDIGECDNLDDEIEAQVVHGGIAGLYTFMESIVMFNSFGEIWAAYIDDTMLRYFANVAGYRQVLPKTIDQWRSRFPSISIAYCEPVVVVPKRDI